MADGCTTMCQEATFYYINAQPQWQNINGGNWLVFNGILATSVIWLCRSANYMFSLENLEYRIFHQGLRPGQPAYIDNLDGWLQNYDFER